MSRPNRICALDLGTTKVCCALADVDQDGMRVIGVGETPAHGVRKGNVVDIERAAESVAQAVDQAERMSGLPIDAAVVGIAGGHIASQNSRGVVAVAAGHHEVRGEDVGRAIQAARAVSVPSDREIVHVLPRHFTVDGQDGVREAVGMTGTRLEVDAHIVTGASTAIQNVVRVMHEADLNVDDMVLQVLASAEAVVSEDEIERGVVVADIGGGTTDVAVFYQGSVTYTGVIPVGGNHVTGDLAVGLRCDLETAEEIKRMYGHALQLTVPADASVTLKPLGYEDAIVIPQRYLAEIIGPRAREMAQLISTEIENSGVAGLLPGGVVLTGGGALLRGFAEITQQETDLPSRVAQPGGMYGIDEVMRGPHHATVAGLLRWGARRNARSGGRVMRQSNNGHRPTTNVRSERLGRWIRNLF